MPYRALTVDRPDCQVVVANLARTERMNAITFEMFEEFAAPQHEVEANAGVRAAILTGEGRTFCAGLNLD